QHLHNRVTGVPRQIVSALDDHVTLKGGNRDEPQIDGTQLLGEFGEVGADGLVAFLVETHEIHFVHRNDDVADTDKMRNVGVASGLCYQTLPSVHQDQREICSAGTRD